VIDYATGDGSTVFILKPDNAVEITNPNGDSVVMSNDGTIKFTHSGTVTIDAGADVEINCVNAKITASADVEVSCVNAKITADANVDVNCANAKITANAEAQIDSPKIKLGKTAAEAVIKGDTFKELYNNHIHPTPVGPTEKPAVPMDAALSQVSSTD
jgi:phage gp45-like